MSVKVLTIGTFLLNVLSINYAIIYAFSQANAPLPNVFGTLIVASFLLNLIIAYRNYRSGEDLRLQKWGTAYLIISMAAMIAMPLGSFAASSVYNPNTAIAITVLTVYPAFIAALFSGAIQARLTYTQYSSSGPKHGKGDLSSEKNKALNSDNALITAPKKAWLGVLSAALAGGIFPAYILLSNYPGMLQVVVSPVTLFLAFFYPALAILIIKVYDQPGRLFSKAVFAGGLFLMVIFILPLLMTPSAVTRAEDSFNSSFGENWRKQVTPYAANYFLPHRFSLPAYFLGLTPGSYRYQRDILFYEGTGGADEGIKLYCDVFMPPDGQTELPGMGSTVIRIHGGAWIAGDKGMANMMQMNKYLASQGYTVFDIQYGLTDRISLPQLMNMYNFLDNLAASLPPSLDISVLGAPGNVRGPFTLNDMMRHLGLFTDFLFDNAEEFGASTEAVFVSGGSAGGHLTTAMSLAIAGGEHRHIFNPGITVKGYIPFYPANRAISVLKEIGGSPEWVDVEKLIRPDSPPCLIFQGTHDGMVPKDTARYFKEAYLEAGNESCAVIYLPLAAHAADFLFTGYYNQVFLYYMERFMFLHK